MTLSPTSGTEIAIIGMNCRFPGAPDLAKFWQNLREGVESIRRFSDEELRLAGIDVSLLNDPNFIKAAAFLEDADAFDADFFEMNYREAAITDPQQRVLLECAWEALEHAGYNPYSYPGAISLFAGATMNTYLLFNLARNREALAGLEPVQLNIGNAGDFLATRVAYKLNLKGASYTVQSACSTALVATYVACEALLNEACNIALAGGVSVNVSFQHGYQYAPGGMSSPDGYCRPFDSKAQGTVFGSGVGLVVLKRLADAIDDGDTIHAVIKGVATNNDGSHKVGYTAPSVDGQANVITEALAMAGVRADSVSYVETHGTATPLGDPIEVQALTKAYRAQTSLTGFCAIGSVKSNIGHLDAAAGVAGLIKTVLALKHRQLPASLHFEQPNPGIDFAQTPFYVNNKLADWPARSGPRRAGISAFGVGGTNAHLILEEAPIPSEPAPSRPFQLLCLSAKTETAVESMVTRLRSHLQNFPGTNMADVAYTLQMGRAQFEYRKFLLVREQKETVVALADPGRMLSGAWSGGGKRRPLAFLFTGQGAQHIQMGRDLYEQERVFRQRVEQSAIMLRSELGLDLRDLIYPLPGREEDAVKKLQQTEFAQPALFVIEYALAHLFRSWGIEPQMLAGHSIGEFVAACLAGVFSLQDALKLVVARGRLMQQMPPGAMLAVPLSEFELEPFLNAELALAAVNSPSRCVVSGTVTAISTLAQQLEIEGIKGHRLQTSHAFHSPMMESAREAFLNLVSQTERQPPKIPLLSNLSGTWLTPDQAINPVYWADHLRQPVRFSDNLVCLLESKDSVLLELGPSGVLSGLARQHPHFDNTHVALGAMRHPKQQENDQATALAALGQLWLAGIAPDWPKFYEHERRSRVPLPTYPFVRQRHWIEPDSPTTNTSVSVIANDRQPQKAWFYMPAWQRILPIRFNEDRLAEKQRNWLILTDMDGLGQSISQALTAAGQTVTLVYSGNRFSEDKNRFTIDPTDPRAYATLAQSLHHRDQMPDVILHLWLLASIEPEGDAQQTFNLCQQIGYYSLLYLLQGVTAVASDASFDLLLVTNQAAALTPNETLIPDKVTSLGLLKVIPQEYPKTRCQVMDVANASPTQMKDAILAAALHLPEQPTALRGAFWWTQHMTPIALPESPGSKFRHRGVYLFTGGLLEIGTAMCHYLAQTYQTRLVLLEPEPFPDPQEWDEWLVSHGPENAISERIRQVQALRQAGSEVIVVGIDWTNGVLIKKAVAEAISRFGPINGVIHNARLLGERSFRMIAETRVLESEWHFQPKIHALRHLAEALGDHPLDFCLLNSSLSSVVGGVGMAAYAAANSFIDAFAIGQHQHFGGVWTSVNWDAWLHTQVSLISPEWAKYALASEEGVAALEQILAASGVDQIILSTVDLAARRQSLKSKSEQPISADKLQTRHKRPQLPVPYVAPASDHERLLAELWQSIFGIEQIGMLDNFFDLGGDSLLAVHAASQLKKEFAIDVPIVSLYERLTIRALAELIENLEVSGTTDDTGNAVEKKAEREVRMNQRREIQQRERAKRQARR